MLKRGKVAKSKAEKAKTSFDMTIKAIRDATFNCTACVGNRSEQEVAIKTCETLSDCPKTASEMCAAAELENYQPGLPTLLANCSEQFEKWEIAYKSALRAESCSDIKKLPSVGNCVNIDWKGTEEGYMKKFTMCVKSSTPGSFGDCRKTERMASYLSYDCVEKCPDTENLSAVVTTASSGRRHKRLSQFSNLLNRNF